MTATRRGWVLAFASTAATACGGSSGSTPADSGAGDDAGRSDAAVDAADAGGDGGARYAGQVLVEKNVPNGQGSEQWSLGARFGAANGFPAFGAPCAGTSSGACCFTPTGGTGEAPASAGAITFSDKGMTLSPLMPDSSGAYATVQSTGTAFQWNDGDTVTVTASGNSVAMFSGSVVTVPVTSGVSLSSPTLSTVPLGQDLLMNWTASGVAGVKVGLTLTGPAGRIDCVVDDSARMLTLPKMLLAHYATGDQGTLQFADYRVAQTTASNADVQIISVTGSTSPVTYQ